MRLLIISVTQQLADVEQKIANLVRQLIVYCSQGRQRSVDVGENQNWL